MNPALATALEYEALGLSVVPLLGKKPTVKGWTRRRRADPDQLTFWFSDDRPMANVGLRTGVTVPAGGYLVAIDIDGEDGFATWDNLVAGRSLPLTARALTGGGGEHQLYLSGVEVANFQRLHGPGLDQRGKGGLIAVEPSIHPDTGRDYVWTRHPRSGIAPLPDWLSRVLATCRPDDARSAVAVPSKPLDPVQVRAGNVDTLALDLMARFPVDGYGMRTGQFKRAVPSLVGRGFDDATIEAVVIDWWSHFYHLGRCRTPPDRASREIRRYIADLRQSPTFGRSCSGVDHRSRCREIRLSDAAYQLMREPVETIQRLIPGPEGRDKPAASGGTAKTNTKRVTQDNDHLWDRLCCSDDEWGFVEALVVRMTYHHTFTEAGSLKVTHDHIREIATDRHPGLKWDNKQFERLKVKYVGRPEYEGKPAKAATRFELLREVVKGHKDTRRAGPGIPSEYEPTGIMALIGPK